jgi:hypothetical protein
MSTQKFSIVVEVKDGKAIAHGFLKEDAQEALSLFNKLRDSQKEAYFFQHPVADKRSKSAEQIVATQGVRTEEVVVNVAPVEEAKAEKPKRGKNSIEGVSN